MVTSTLLFGLLASAVVTTSGVTEPAPAKETFSANVAKSTITWKGYKVLGSHTGTIQLKEGKLDYTDGSLTGGYFIIDMATLDCTDLTGEYKDKLVGHLKSDDFFGVANHPTAKFQITKVISRGKPGEYKIVGNLTIKETTKEIKFLTTIDESSDAPVANATIKVDRSEFNVRYGSGSFFDNLGDNTIYDEFDLNISLVLNK